MVSQLGNKYSQTVNSCVTSFVESQCALDNVYRYTCGLQILSYLLYLSQRKTNPWMANIVLFFRMSTLVPLAKSLPSPSMIIRSHQYNCQLP